MSGRSKQRGRAKKDWPARILTCSSSGVLQVNATLSGLDPVMEGRYTTRKVKPAGRSVGRAAGERGQSMLMQSRRRRRRHMQDTAPRSTPWFLRQTLQMA